MHTNTQSVEHIKLCNVIIADLLLIGATEETSCLIVCSSIFVSPLTDKPFNLFKEPLT